MRTVNSISKFVLKKTPNRIKKVCFFISSFIATGCFVGKIKYVPGTFGSLLAILLSIPFVKLSMSIQIIILGFLLTIGALSTHLYLIKIKDLLKDPKEVVIDEIFAIFMIVVLSQFIVQKLEWNHFLSIFVLFRLFDISKPYPISYIDKNIHGAKGIMLDDILAGFASLLIFIIAYS